MAVVHWVLPHHRKKAFFPAIGLPGLKSGARRSAESRRLLICSKTIDRVLKRAALAFKGKLEQLLEYRRTGATLPDAMVSWLASLGVEIYDELVRVGLARQRRRGKLLHSLLQNIAERGRKGRNWQARGVS